MDDLTHTIADMAAGLRRGDNVHHGQYPHLTDANFFQSYTEAFKALLAEKNDLIADRDVLIADRDDSIMRAAEEQASLRYAHHVMDVLEAMAY
jgi:hypothetical protein